MSIFYKDKKHAESYCVVLTLVKMFWKFLISFELQNTYKSWHGLASLLSFNFTVTYGISNFFIAKAYMNVFFLVLSCPVSIKSCYVVQKSPLNEINSSQSRSSSNLCSLTYCSSFSSTKDRLVFRNIHLISKLVTW